MTRNIYVRPLVQHGAARPDDARPLAGGALWFTHAEILSRDAAASIVPANRVPAGQLARLTAPREDIVGLDMAQPHLMGILNVTPDSFSDGGQHNAPEHAKAAALRMVQQGASLIDVGGESTRPGAAFVSEELETIRTEPVISLVKAETIAPISIDTRKASVARTALKAGASLVNDVSGFTFDPELAPLCAASGVPVCIMHAQGDPETMQQNPVYDDVLLDVYDFLERQIVKLGAFGIPRAQIIADPGIGFGKTQEHNLKLLKNMGLFHALGCPVLLGASRKKFIGSIGGEPEAGARAPGSIAVGLAALAQGVQILRVHDVAETAQALSLWRAVR